MSKRIASQMEAVLMEKIQNVQQKLEKLQQKNKLEIGDLAYKHGLQEFDIKTLENVFKKIARELSHAPI